MTDVPECGWCGTPFTAAAWCDHCLEERDFWHVTHHNDRQRDKNAAGIEAARQALRDARTRKGPADG